MNLDNWDPRTKPGMEGRQGRARQEAEGLRAQIASKVLANSTTILVTRDVTITPSIVTEAKKHPNNIIMLDFLSLEKGMFKQIYGDNPKSLPFNTETIGRMNMLLVDVADKLAVISMPTLKGSGNLYGVASSKEEILSKMETAMVEAYDTELKSAFLRSLIMDETANKLNNDAIAVFIVNVPNNFTKALSNFTGRTIVATEDASNLGAVVLQADSSAEELVNAVTQAQAAEKKKPKTSRVKGTNEI
jgi:hypothetical protein